MCSEHRIRGFATKLHDMFFTRAKWRNFSGFFGFAVGLRNGGVTELALHGPSNLCDVVNAANFFVGRNNLKLSVIEESDSTPTYEDENVKITTIELFPSGGTKSSDDRSNGEDYPRSKRAKSADFSSPTAAFICKLVDVPGKFSAKKATELGLPSGPLRKQLVEGESVVTPDGRVVRPSDVLGETQKGPTFVVLECPSVDFVAAVTSHPSLQESAFTSSEQRLSLVVHISPVEVLQNEEYIKWMVSFGADTKHLILNETHAPSEVSIRAVLKIQCPLHLMNPSAHHPPPLPPPPVLSTEVQGDPALLKISELLPKESVVFASSFLKYYLKPLHKTGVDFTETLKPMQAEVEERLKEIASDSKLVSNILHPLDLREKEDSSLSRHDVTSKPSLVVPPSPQLCLSNTTSLLGPLGDSPDDAIITFLGTAASCPSKYRNVSGILIQTPKYGNVILDCGEGTLSQLYRCFGAKTGDEIVRSISLVFISHIHGDHHFGLPSVLLKRLSLAGSGSPVVVVVAPGIYQHWWTSGGMAQQDIPFQFVNCKDLTGRDNRFTSSSLCGGMGLQTVPVKHCREAYGVVIRNEDSWRIVYSGDTRPCPALIEAGRNATLLIHEATFEDDLIANAIEHNHCTMSEALDVAKKMNPGFTILTHFSQRYPKVSSSLLNQGSLNSQVGIAFDCMSVRLSELHTLPSYLHAMKDVFPTILGGDEDSSQSDNHLSSWTW